MVNLGGLVYGLVAFLIVGSPGLVLLWMGYAWRRISTQIESLEETTPDTVSPGLAKVVGPAASVNDGGTARTPLTGTDSLVYEFVVEGYRPDADGNDWFDVVEETERRQFRLEGTTRDTLVDPSEFDIQLADAYSETVSSYAEAPPEIQAYVDDHPEDLLTPRKTRFTERRLEPGEEAYVVGTASREAGSGTRIGTGNSSWFERAKGVPRVVSDQSESAVLDEQGQWATAALFGGVFWLLLSSFWLVMPLLASL